jgi:hypothetical protein
MLPPGFRARVVARGGQPVAGTTYEWHVFSDGQATFRTEDGGFILVSNSENPPDLGVTVPGSPGGASAIRFRADGSIADAQLRWTYTFRDGRLAAASSGPLAA